MKRGDTMSAVDTNEATKTNFPPSTWVLFADHNNKHPIRAELFGLEHLEKYARKLGTLTAKTRVESGRPLPSLFAHTAQALREAYQIISEAYRQQEPLGNDAEWLLDNYHIISDALAEIRTDLPRGYYQR